MKTVKIKSTVYPYEYNKNARPGTIEYVKAYNRTMQYIRESLVKIDSEKAMENTLNEAKSILQ